MLTLLRYLRFTAFILLTGNAIAQTAGDYRSFQTGTWATNTNWETFDGTSWIIATVAPNNTNGVITVQNGHNMTINAAITIDEAIVNNGGTITIAPAAGVNITLNQITIDAGGMVNWTGGNCIIGNGVTGSDLIVNGTFWDNRGAATPSISFTGGATWEIGANGTLRRSAGNSSNNWQNAYQGGISTIPSTSNWVLRKTASQNPTISSTGAFYGNLIIENFNAGTWTTATGSTFNGGGLVTIKGDLDIGGTGTTFVDFLNNTLNALPVQVTGNLIVRAGNTLRNYGTGVSVQGNFDINGTISYDLTDARLIECSGPNTQIIDGTGAFNIYNFTLNKTGGDVVLNRSITIDNIATFTNGVMYSSATALPTINTYGSVTGASNSSFVSGPVRYVGNNAFTFPVGKSIDYQPIGISAGTAPVTFWTEPFSNACSSGCLATGYTGTNGSWTMTDNSPLNDACGFALEPNTWFVSGNECGNAPGACGSVCGTTDPSLHISATTTGDLGAAYDAGGWCDFGLGGLGSGTTTDKRIESPTINCSLYSNIILSFNYIEGGQGTSDNATLWYFDGSAWSLLADMAKTATGCGGQGIWTTYTITLPASANGNANVKIGFRWVNNDDGAGSDPSFAVDDITLTQPAPISDFTAEYFYSDPQAPYGNILVPSLASISNCEYWILDRNAGSTVSKQVTLTWDANSCNLPAAVADFRVARHDGISTWQNEGNTATTGTLTAGTVTSAPVTNFSPFTLGSAVVVLPIELIQFNAVANENHTDITWTTQTEINNEHFTVERSSNGTDFYFIKNLPGAGNSSQTKHYHTTDDKPLTGKNYYRLKQTDFDGAFSYSDIRVVEFTGESRVQINYVSGNNGEITLSYSSEENDDLTISIMDAAGKTVYTSSALPGLRQVKVPANIAKGMYILTLSNGVKTDQKKFVVE